MSQVHAVIEADDVQVDVRCSVVVLQNDRVLLLRRGHRQRPRLLDNLRNEDLGHAGDWVLPGGRPRPGESMAACARRETQEETGLAVNVGRCLFVLEVADVGADRLLELVFHATANDPQQEPEPTEEGLHPEFIALADLHNIHLRPPLAGHLRGLHIGRDTGAPYLGNLWRPRRASDTT